MANTSGGYTQNTPTVGASNVPAFPEFTRLPRNGTKCFYSGLGRSSLNQLILPSEENGFTPPVKSIVLRKRGNSRGARLIVYASLREYLLAQVEKSTADGKEALPAVIGKEDSAA